MVLVTVDSDRQQIAFCRISVASGPMARKMFSRRANTSAERGGPKVEKKKHQRTIEVFRGSSYSSKVGSKRPAVASGANVIWSVLRVFYYEER
jgi:hypothetical protein